MGFGQKYGRAPFLHAFGPKIECAQHFVKGQIHQLVVKGHIHMAVVINPLRFNPPDGGDKGREKQSGQCFLVGQTET